MSYASNGSPIDVLTSGTSIKMLEIAKIQAVKVYLDSYDNSALTNYTFTIVPSVPII